MTAGLLHKEPRIGAPRDDFKFLGHVIDCACFVSFLFFLSGNCQTALGGSCNVSLFTHVELECFSNLVVTVSRAPSGRREVASPGPGSHRG